MATPSPPGPSSQDPGIADLSALTSSLVKSGQMAPEHQLKLIKVATDATGKIDDLRKFLDLHASKGRLLAAQQPQEPVRQQVLDSVSSTVLSVNRVQSVFSLLSEAGQDAAQKIVSFILGRLMAVLDDFKKHLQYQNWSVNFVAGIPFTLQVGVTITFQ
jgi:hypothetical protein